MAPVYDHLSRNYDATRRPDPVIAQRLFALLRLPAKGRCLDLACGTGNYTMALRGFGANIEGLDQSEQMLAAASAKAPSMTWTQGVVEDLPFEDNSFDGAICTLAVHHFEDVAAAFREACRVLKPGGRLVLFTFDDEQMEGYWLNEYFPNAMRRSIEAAPSLTKTLARLAYAGFEEIEQEPFFVEPDARDFFLYSGKHKPEMYLDLAVRENISTFSIMSEPKEVRAGVARLRADIDSGEIERVIQKYKDRGAKGDYLFIAAAKPKA